MATIRVQDGSRYLEFDGTLLAEATSDDGRSQRWTVVKIYKSNTGRYIVHKIGESVVYHTDNNRCGKHAKVATAKQIRDEFPDKGDDTLVWYDFIPCRRCSPGEIGTVDNRRFRVEQPRFSAQLSDNPKGLIETLHRRDDNGVTFIPNVARSALEAAARKDPALADAWLVQRV